MTSNPIDAQRYNEFAASIMPAPGASEVGAELATYLNATATTGGDPNHLTDIVERFTAAPATTIADALALVSWISALLPQALAVPIEDEGTAVALRHIIGNACNMADRARDALVTSTGIPPEAFTGIPGKAN
ncbi:hypothetical protein [Aureimonas psammosilenae]|uniref:hypothetical protein n=1 Tax=Aureimonas psammosilenae TaxID=2495496 RepID=UPI001261186E|nr:hypothetical protein [Aureimonas psammosilenae]